jgi:gliding motility associated protien GldN
MGFAVLAQSDDSPVDGFLQKTELKNVKPVPFPEIRQSDVYSVKRIWRDIDIKDKRNKFFADPQSRFIDIILNAIDNHTITAYDATYSEADPTGDKFKVKLSAKSARVKFIDSIMVDSIDKKTGDKISSHLVAATFNPDSVTKFRIKEDWIFDKQRSVYEPRIVGIAPLYRIKVEGIVFSEQPAFWIYFNQARNIFVNNEVITPGNTILSYDDIFVLRKFASRIVKESNPEDLRIKDYAKTEQEAEKEANRIEAKLHSYKSQIYSHK